MWCRLMYGVWVLVLTLRVRWMAARERQVRVLVWEACVALEVGVYRGIRGFGRG